MGPHEPEDDFVHESFKDDGLAIGQKGDGLDIFPMSELAARLAARDSDDAAIASAIEQLIRGFPIEESCDRDEG